MLKLIHMAIKYDRISSVLFLNLVEVNSSVGFIKTTLNIGYERPSC